MVARWRQLFHQWLWFGFVQIASCATCYAGLNTSGSAEAAELRQAQLAALALGNVGLSSAVDTGDWANIHPLDKQSPSARLVDQALVALEQQLARRNAQAVGRLPSHSPS